VYTLKEQTCWMAAVAWFNSIRARRDAAAGVLVIMSGPQYGVKEQRTTCMESKALGHGDTVELAQFSTLACLYHVMWCVPSTTHTSQWEMRSERVTGEVLLVVWGSVRCVSIDVEEI